MKKLDLEVSYSREQLFFWADFEDEGITVDFVSENDELMLTLLEEEK